jgi:hypothetical protein
MVDVWHGHVRSDGGGAVNEDGRRGRVEDAVEERKRLVA